MASIEDQEREMRHVAERYRLNIVDVITDEGTAKKPGRPGFSRLVQSIRKGKADAVLTWRLNRLARNSVDGGEITWLVQQSEIKEIRTYSGVHRPSDNVLFLFIAFGMATQFSKELSADVARGLRNKGFRGWWPYRAPLGYQTRSPKKFKNPEKEIVIDKTLFPLIQGYWKKLANGSHTIQELHEHAVLHGVTLRKGKPISLSAFYRLFTNEFYYGFYTITDAEGVAHRIQGKHTPMISEQLFKKVRRRLNGTSKTPVHSSNPYKGILSCGSCPAAVVLERKEHTRCTNCNRKFSSVRRDSCPDCGITIQDMRCPTQLSKTYIHCCGRGRGCSEPSIELRKFEQLLSELMATLSIDERLYEILVESAGIAYDHVSKEQHQEKERVLKRRSEIESERNYISAYAAKVDMPKDQYQATIRTYDAQIEKLNMQLEQFSQQSKSHFLHMFKDATSFVSKLKKHVLHGQSEEKNQLVRKLCSNLEIRSGGLTIRENSLLKGFAKVVKQLAYISPWLEPGDSGITLKRQPGFKRSALVQDAVPVMCTYVEQARTFLQ